MPVPSPLAVRMKAYEASTGSALPNDTWAIIRLDGKAFHTYTRGLNKPFDRRLILDMDLLTNYLCTKVGGAVFGYTQSDEISIVLSDQKNMDRQHWFGGKTQKIVSVAASYAGAYFNHIRQDLAGEDFPVFDARVFALPSEAEVRNYLTWRQMDAQRNAIFLAANAVYSHKQLLGKSFSEKKVMLRDAGLDWESDYTDREKLGGISVRVAYNAEVTYTHKETGESETVLADRTTWLSRGAVPFKDNVSSPLFSFLQPEEPLCPMSEFLSLEPMPV